MQRLHVAALHRCTRASASPMANVCAGSVRFQRKPPWVGSELMRIKAWSPELGCRTISEVFNRQFAHQRITVSKSYVATVLRDKRLAILRLRRTLKHRVPRTLDKNRIWALDLTSKADLTGQQRLMLGVLGHGMRAVLLLSELRNKTSLMILRELIAAFRRFGIPRALRTDNERCFTSKTMRLALAILGIRQQRTELHCPWVSRDFAWHGHAPTNDRTGMCGPDYGAGIAQQNGRIERFFGSLKRHLDRIQLADAEELRIKLIEFRAFYNHARTHAHLGGRTPAEAWAGKDRSVGEPLFVSLWDDRLRGWFFPP
jgi:putative transposase